MFTASYRQGATEKLWPHFFSTSVASGVLFCKSQSGSACRDAQGLAEARAARRAPTIAAQRSLERAASPTFIILLAHPEKNTSNARCCTVLEFSSGEINTMWPCRGSNCCPIWESLLIQDLRMGKLQSKHGKKAASSCRNKHRLTNQLWFDCITRAKEIICVKK